MIFEQWLASPWLESARLAFRCEERDLFASTVSMFVDQRNEIIRQSVRMSVAQDAPTLPMVTPLATQLGRVSVADDAAGR
eukprot:symbB.v1.2.038021.t1/scaffold5525.1/size26800/2